MGKSIETKASSVDLAVEKALEELQTTRDKVDVEVLSKGGLFQKAVVKVSVKDTAECLAEEFVNGLLQKMGLTSRASAEDLDGTVSIVIEGDDTGAVIGYRGEALDAVQYLTLTYLNQEKCQFAKVVVDCENYREKRRETLTTLAYRLAEKAHRICRKVELEPMNPFERRIIHNALIGSEIARTESEGQEPYRHVVIIPLGVELRSDRPRDGRRGDGRRDNRRDGGRRDESRGGRSFSDRPDRGERPDRRRPTEDEEVPDGREFRGYYTEAREAVKPAAKRSGPPKFKSFGGAKKF